MSDGFVTVAQCVEGLPVGRFVWELLMCGFLVWFLLGAINEVTPLAFSIVRTDWPTSQESVMGMSAALAMGNLFAIAVSGWLADVQGRLAVVRPALVLTVAAGLMLQSSTSLLEACAARFVLGLVSGGLLCVVPPLIAELLPSTHRGFYLTVWCCGWPAGALFSLLLACTMPGLNIQEFYTILLMPAFFVWMCMRGDVFLESPRFLYLTGQREEGYNTLLDMYEKQDLPLPWAAESIAVTGASSLAMTLAGDARMTSRRAGCQATSRTGVAMWLALTMFLASAAAQSVKLWMPLMVVAHNEETGAPPIIGASPSLLAFAAGPRATNLLSLARAPLMSAKPSYNAIRVLAQAYTVEFLGIIACAYLSTLVRRKHLVRWPLLAASVLTVLNLPAAAGRSFVPLCAPLVGLQLAAQACGLNFLQVFASEYFPTSRRAQIVAFANFAAQVGSFSIPLVGGLVVRSASASAAVVFFSALYLLAWVASYMLPLPAGPERPLHDVDDAPERSPLSGGAASALKKRGLAPLYQSTESSGGLAVA